MSRPRLHRSPIGRRMDHRRMREAQILDRFYKAVETQWRVDKRQSGEIPSDPIEELGRALEEILPERKAPHAGGGERPASGDRKPSRTPSPPRSKAGSGLGIAIEAFANKVAGNTARDAVLLPPDRLRFFIKMKYS